VNRRQFTTREDRILRKLFANTRSAAIATKLGRSVLSVSNRAHKLGLRKSAAHLRKTWRECGLEACEAGKASRFPKGHVPANKGTRRPGWSAGRMRETQFRKGQEPRNTMPMWSFRFVDGYLMLKTGKRHAPPNDRWEYVHRLIWEHWNGPLPHWRDARIWWKDGDHGNCSLSNLELVPANEHMSRTTVHNLPKPLVEVIQLAGALKRKIRNKEKKLNGQEHAAGSPGSPVRDAGIAV